jgi:hypothetical protein
MWWQAAAVPRPDAANSRGIPRLCRGAAFYASSLLRLADGISEPLSPS